MINLASGFGDCYANWTVNNNNMEPANDFRRQLRSRNILALVKTPRWSVQQGVSDFYVNAFLLRLPSNNQNA